ncbi:MAG: FGGY-family carbohydrate kinase [Pirellulales bacterium]
MTSPAAYVLAVDLGSSGPKVALFSERAELVAQATAAVATRATADGGGEQDPAEWWRATTACVQSIVAERHVPVERIAAISCAAQWSVTAAVDAAGEPLMNAVHWSDSRGAPYTRQITDGWIKVSGYGLRRMLAWVRLTGGVPTHSGADALAHILFIKHERPDVYRRTHKFLEPVDFLNLRLTGRMCASHASVFPYLLTDNRDNTRVKYAQQLISWCGLDREKLPELVPVGSIVGTLLPAAAAAWGLPAGTPVVAGTPDSQAAALGSGATRDFAAHACVGTTAWLSCHVPFKKTNLLDYLATMPSALHGRNMVTAEQGAAGKCLETLVEQWLFADADRSPDGRAGVYEQVERLAASAAPGSDGLLFLPWLNGAGPPSGDSTMRGGFLNQSLRTGRAEAVRAVIEGVSFNLRWLQASVERFVGRRFAELNFIGRAAKSEVWCETLADVLDRPVHRMSEPQMATSRGAALAALVALGRISVAQIPDLVRVERTFQPDAARAAMYRDLFTTWLASYKATRPIFRRLQRHSAGANGAAAKLSTIDRH